MGLPGMLSTNYRRYLNEFFPYDVYLWENSARAVGQSDETHLVLEGGRTVCSWKRLTWDTRVLGVTTGRIENIFFAQPLSPPAIESLVTRIDAALRDADIGLGVVRLGPSDPEFRSAFEARGWVPVDALNIYALSAPHILGGRVRPAESSITVCEPTAEEGSSFIDSNGALFEDARMHRDANVDPAAARRFYRELFHALLLKAGMQRKAIRRKGEIIGLAIGAPDLAVETFRLGCLWQLAVAPAHRGKGYAKLLLNAFLTEIAPSVNVVEIGTQENNLAANRLYASRGARLVATAVTLHKWFGAPLRSVAGRP